MFFDRPLRIVVELAGRKTGLTNQGFVRPRCHLFGVSLVAYAWNVRDLDKAVVHVQGCG